MEGFLASCGFAILTYVLIAVGAFLALLRVAFVILVHPFQALKKTPRDGNLGREGLHGLGKVEERGYCIISQLSLPLLSPPGLSVGPLSGGTRVCDSQWAQVPLCYCW